MSNKTADLQSDLRAAGANATEAAELASLATELKVLKGYQAINEFQSRKHSWPKALGLAGVTILSVIIGMAVVTFSQTSLPGSMLYPVKRLSENGMATVDPHFKGNMMMRRAQEVKTLVARHAADTTILATLSDYQQEAAAYHYKNYAVFEYCEDSLAAALPTASQPVKTAIQQTLYNLKNS